MAPKKIVSTVLPTTMVGSYPRPHWFHDQLHGQDVRVAFKNVDHAEAYEDATIVAIRDQEEAGLDIITDGQMSYDDYVGVIGSFCWYMYERIGGFDPAKEPHPSRSAPRSAPRRSSCSPTGAAYQQRPRHTRPIRLTDLYKVAAKHATKPLKVSVGAGPVNLAWHVHFQHYKDAKELSYALAPIFNAEMKELVAAGADYLQIEDLGAWLPLFTDNEEDYKWIGDVIAQCVDGVDARIGWHFCFGNAWATRCRGSSRPATARAPYFYDTPIDEFVLDFANRDMEDIDLLSSLPEDKSVAVGVLDIRTMMVESPEKVAERIRKVIEVVPPERVNLTTDCGMKPLPRLVAKMKLKALVEGAEIVRSELR